MKIYLEFNGSQTPSSQGADLLSKNTKEVLDKKSLSDKSMSNDGSANSRNTSDESISQKPEDSNDVLANIILVDVVDAKKNIKDKEDASSDDEEEGSISVDPENRGEVYGPDSDSNREDVKRKNGSDQLRVRGQVPSEPDDVTKEASTPHEIQVPVNDNQFEVIVPSFHKTNINETHNVFVIDAYEKFYKIMNSVIENNRNVTTEKHENPTSKGFLANDDENTKQANAYNENTKQANAYDENTEHANAYKEIVKRLEELFFRFITAPNIDVLTTYCIQMKGIIEKFKNQKFTAQFDDLLNLVNTVEQYKKDKISSGYYAENNESLKNKYRGAKYSYYGGLFLSIVGAFFTYVIPIALPVIVMGIISMLYGYKGLRDIRKKLASSNSEQPNPANEQESHSLALNSVEKKKYVYAQNAILIKVRDLLQTKYEKYKMTDINKSSFEQKQIKLVDKILRKLDPEADIDSLETIKKHYSKLLVKIKDPIRTVQYVISYAGFGLAVAALGTNFFPHIALAFLTSTIIGYFSVISLFVGGAIIAKKLYDRNEMLKEALSFAQKTIKMLNSYIQILLTMGIENTIPGMTTGIGSKNMQQRVEDVQKIVDHKNGPSKEVFLQEEVTTQGKVTSKNFFKNHEPNLGTFVNGNNGSGRPEDKEQDASQVQLKA